MDTLDSKGKWGSLPDHQKGTLVAMVSSFHVVFLECIALFQDAFNACEESDSEIGFVSEHNPLDQAAALMIGFMEGQHFRGSRDEDGRFLFGLANSMAYKFDTLNSDEYARINGEIENLLYAAKGQLDALDCYKVLKSVNEIRNLLFVPLLQGILDAATSGAGVDSNVQGEILALAVLPTIEKETMQPEVASVLYNQMVTGDASNSDATAVGDAVGNFWHNGVMYSCSYLGGNKDVEPCRSYGGRSGATTAWSSWALAVSTAAGAFLLTA